MGEDMVSENDRPLGTKEFAEFMGVAEWTARKWLREGKVPKSYTLGGRHYVDLGDAKRFKNLQRDAGDSETNNKQHGPTTNNTNQHGGAS